MWVWSLALGRSQFLRLNAVKCLDARLRRLCGRRLDAGDDDRAGLAVDIDDNMPISPWRPSVVNLGKFNTAPVFSPHAYSISHPFFPLPIV